MRFSILKVIVEGLAQPNAILKQIGVNQVLKIIMYLLRNNYSESFLIV